MRSLESVVYRYLTDADFFNIYKPPGTESTGGGQTYIDFSTRDIPVSRWRHFLRRVPTTVHSRQAKGPGWELPVGNIAVPGPPQRVFIYQRRSASVIVSSQRLGSRRSNRLRAWHPENGFPKPIDPTSRHQCPVGLVVFLARCTDRSLWVGWFLNDGYSPQPFDSRETEIALGALVVAPGDTDPRAGFISVSGASVLLDESSHQNPFRALSRGRAAKSSTQTAGPDPESETAIDNMFSEDMAQTSVSPSYSVTRIRRRNTKAANTLKKLYKHTCQITGTDFLFKKRDGTYYTEVHHLIPLGEGGADNPRNMVVLSPQLHKMLHHATVDPIDLSQMKRAADGRWYLEININQTSYRIHWLPAHAKVIQAADQ